jgi:hypothetical protein
MSSYPAIPNTCNVPLLLCHEQFNEASLLVWAYWLTSWTYGPLADAEALQTFAETLDSAGAVLKQWMPWSHPVL